MKVTVGLGVCDVVTTFFLTVHEWLWDPTTLFVQQDSFAKLHQLFT